MADPIEEFFGSYDASVGRIARDTRKLVRRIVPKAEEKLLRSWKTVAYGRGGKGKQFCAISPHKAWVNLQFHSGSSLEDPFQLLEGTGKSMRHVKLAEPADLKRRGLRDLLREAADLAN
jgi:hypothetical protein